MRNPNVLIAATGLTALALLGTTACSDTAPAPGTTAAPTPSKTPELVCNGSLVEIGALPALSSDNIRIFTANLISPDGCAKLTDLAGNEVDRLISDPHHGDAFGACNYKDLTYATKFDEHTDNHGPWGILKISADAPAEVFENCATGVDGQPLLPGALTGPCTIPGKTEIKANDPHCFPDPSQRD